MSLVKASLVKPPEPQAVLLDLFAERQNWLERHFQSGQIA